jgi:HK97 family phage portal protein
MKNLIKNIFGLGESAAAFTQKSAMNSDMWRFIGKEPTDAGIEIDQNSAMGLTPVFAAINIISNFIGMMPVDLYRQNTGGDMEEVKDHPALKLLNAAPNDHMISIAQRTTQISHALGWGNGYAEIEFDGRGNPTGIWPLLPDRTTPAKLANGEIVYNTRIDGKEYNLDRSRVVHIPALSFDGYVGLSPITIARQSLGSARAAEKFGGKFFGNDAKSGGFIHYPGKLGDPAVKNLSESVNKDKGTDHAHKIRVLEEGAKFISTTISPNDSQFLETREFHVAEVARLYQIPLVLLQSMQGTTAWGTGIETLMLGFYTMTLLPWAVKCEQEFNKKLLTEDERGRGYTFKINFNSILRADMAARGQFYNLGISGGWLVRNEVRKKENLPPLPGLDDPLQPLNMAKVGDNSEEEPEE